MGDLVNLVAPFFSTPTNYAQMLKKLAGFAFYEVFLITLLLRQVPEIDQWLRSIEAYGKVGSLISTIPHWEALNVAGFLIALLAAVLSHAFHLHDRISDILGIRRRFDRDKILLPLAELVGIHVSAKMRSAIEAQRHSLMRDVFYRYASSRSDKAVVDKHDIEHALSAWAWFWACIEGTVFFLVGAIVALIFGAEGLLRLFGFVIVLLTLLAFLIKLRLPGYARAEIKAIASNVSAARHVHAAFNAL